MKKALYIILIIFSLIGIAASGYLTYNHYAVGESFCDVSTTVSCSLVNSSVYSELFNIPVAALGILWFVYLGLFSIKLLKKEDSAFKKGLLYLSYAGLGFVLYMILAEILLQALCPTCTFVHILVLIIFGISLYLNKGIKKQKDLKDKLGGYIFSAIVAFVLIFVLFNIPLNYGQNFDEVAQCITEKEVNMYGSFKCGSCAKVRNAFGDSFQYINEIECHPDGENSQWELCQEKKIEGTPTFIYEPNGQEEKRYKGFLSPENLAKFAGCEI